MRAKVLSLKLPSSPTWYIVPAAALLLLLGLLLTNGVISVNTEAVTDFLTGEFALYVLVGLAAQLVDGALGMAYGVTSNSFLLSLGVTPAVSSASVHFAEMFTTGASAISHFRFKNINKK